MVKHLKGSGFRVIGNNTGKNLGTFKTEGAAKKHEQQVRYFMYAAPGHKYGKK
jgi:hypothetical protein